MALSKEQSAQVLARMRERLSMLEDEISRKLGDSAEELATFDRVGDTGDLSQAIANSEIDLSEASRDIDEWRTLRAAIRRINEGTYGVCTDCGADIPFRRLEVQPVALRCINCQEQAERTANVARG